MAYVTILHTYSIPFLFVQYCLRFFPRIAFDSHELSFFSLAGLEYFMCEVKYNQNLADPSVLILISPTFGPVYWGAGKVKTFLEQYSITEFTV